MEPTVEGVVIPNASDSWENVSKFALSYNGYELFGAESGKFRSGEFRSGEFGQGDDSSVENLGSFANAASERWIREGKLPESLHELRCALFFEQRRAGHGFPFDFEVEREWENPRSEYFEWISYVKALIEGIRSLASDPRILSTQDAMEDGIETSLEP